MGLFDKLRGNKKETVEETKTVPENVTEPEEKAEALPEEKKPATANLQAEPAAAPKPGDAFARITANEKVYIIINNKLPKPWPAIDMNGYMHVYTNPEEAASESDPSNGYVVTELTGEKLGGYLTIWQREGILKIRYSENGNRMQFDAKELGLSPDFSSLMQFTTIRFLQAMTGDTDAHQATAQTWWSALCHVIPGTFFLVPVCYDDEEPETEINDTTMHLFPHAAERLQKLIAEGKGFTIPDYPYAEKSEGKPMHFRTLANSGSGEQWLSAYTSLEEMLPLWHGKAHFALALFDDMKDNYSPSMGILVNPLSTALKLTPAQIADIDKERHEPPKIFSPKPNPDDWAKGPVVPGKKYPNSLYETQDKNANPPYAIIELPDGIYIRVVDFLFRKLSDEHTTPGSGYAMALFRLRMKEVDWLKSDKAKLDALAKRLLEEIPADRFVQALAISPNGARELKIKPGCPTID